jgi:hypothetical protein
MTNFTRALSDLSAEFKEIWPEHDPPIIFRLEAKDTGKHVEFIAKSRTQLLNQSCLEGLIVLWNTLFPEEMQDNINRLKADPIFQERVKLLLKEIPPKDVG